MTAPISNEMKELRKTRITLSVQAAAEDVVENMHRLRILDDCIEGLCELRESFRTEHIKTMGNWEIT